jgi:hypothetical protein
MKIHHEKHRLNVTGSDLSGSLFDDALWKEREASPAGKS